MTPDPSGFVRWITIAGWQVKHRTTMNPIVSENDSDDDEEHSKFSALLNDVDTLLSSTSNGEVAQKPLILSPESETKMNELQLHNNGDMDSPTIIKTRSSSSQALFTHISQHLAAASEVLSESDPLMSAKVSLRLCNEVSDMLRDFICTEEGMTSPIKSSPSSLSSLASSLINTSHKDNTGKISLTNLGMDIFKVIAQCLPSLEKVYLCLTGKESQKMMVGSTLDLTEDDKISAKSTDQVILYKLSPYRLYLEQDQFLNLCTCPSSRVLQSLASGSTLSVKDKQLYLEDDFLAKEAESRCLRQVGFQQPWCITAIPLLHDHSHLTLHALLSRIHSHQYLVKLVIGPKAKNILNYIACAAHDGYLPKLVRVAYYHDCNFMNFPFLGTLSSFGTFGTKLVKIALCDFMNSGYAKVSGSISSLKACQCLRQLFLGGENVHGDVSDISTLSNLEELSLCCTSIYGDVAVLTQLPNLVLLDLSHSQVTGLLQPLSDLTSLRILSVISTRLEGSIVSLGIMTHLRFFFLAKTLINRRADARIQFTQQNPKCEMDLTAYAKSPLFSRKFADFLNTP